MGAQRRVSVGSVLRVRSFLALSIGQTISQFGDRLNHMALIALVSDMMPGSTFKFSKLMIFVTVPGLIFGPISGVFVDRLNKKKVLIFCDMMRASLVLLIPLFFSPYISRFMSPSTASHVVFAVVFLVFSAGLFYSPAKLALIPNVIARRKLLMAGSVASFGARASTVIGAVAGGMIVGYLGWRISFVLDALTYVFSAGMLLLVTYRPAVRGAQDIEVAPPSQQQKGMQATLRESKKIFREVWEGLRFAFTHKATVFAFASAIALALAGGSLYVLVIVLVKEELGKGMEGLGTLIGSLGIGMILGSLLVGRFGHAITQRRLILGGLTAFGIVVIVFAQMKNLVFMNLLACVAGISLAPVLICLDALLQKSVPDQFRGRVFSARDSLLNGGFLISSVLVGLVAENLDKATTLTFVGLALMAIVLLIRQLSRGLPET
ncbi:MAG: MFS transporter [Candidatus Eiseniibacteriota bacterium]|nr:MAG: MFS transporter [Candidatus Eisenbacteria bacterium]